MGEFIRPKFMDISRLLCKGSNKTCLILIMVFVQIISFGCGIKNTQKPANTYTIPAGQLEKNYGQLITVANMPTSAQNGTGDRLGLFKDEKGNFWGIPLTRDDKGNVLGCAPETLREVAISDTLPANTSAVVGAANEPTNWRGGTGNLELLLRTTQGELIWHSVKEVETKLAPVCWSQSDPVQPLPFYRLAIAKSNE